VTPARVDRIDTQTGERVPVRELAVADPAGVTSFAGVRPTPDGRTIAFLVVRRLSSLYVVRGLQGR